MWTTDDGFPFFLKRQPLYSPTNTDTPFKIHAGLTTIHGSLSISPILISSLLISPQTTPETPGCLSSKQEFPNPTDHPHVDGPLSTPPTLDKIQLSISPLYKLHLVFIPHPFNRPTCSPHHPQVERTLESSSTPPSLSQIASCQPVLLVLPMKLLHQDCSLSSSSAIVI